MKNCKDWEQEIAAEPGSAGIDQHLEACERCREFANELERNRVALRECTIEPAVLAAVRQRVISEIQSKKRRTVGWAWLGAAAAACIAIFSVSYIAQSPVAPMPVIARKDPPKIEWTLPQPVRRGVHPTSSGWFRAQTTPVRKTEPLAVIKMLTNDPNVIIIWLVDQKGDSL